ncbi:unnamed protein product [Owenia fusiformis]|uniref:Uncharacterized protein n=1 Tax=Owenia fusiformis TaxID=6347 RepID=A0A8S4PK53_OWEFU|nr:unnamed protein product [Owenia fusiformis]
MVRYKQHQQGPMAAVSMLFVVMVMLPIVTGIPSFSSTGRIETAAVGDSISFDCAINGWDITTQVKWVYSDHNLQISIGTTILAETVRKYQIVRPMTDSDGAVHFNLQISDIDVTDHGVYVCKVTGGGSTIKQINTLTVKGAVPPTSEPIIFPPANFTKCCKDAEVSAQCLPICAPSTVNLDTFNPDNCKTDLDKLLKCGADGRNHARCCANRGIPAKCIDLCYGEAIPLTADFDICLTSTTKVVSCFEEGQLTLPRPPTAVAANSMAYNKISLQWSAPENNDKLLSPLTGYRIFYQESNKRNQGYKSQQLESTVTSRAISGLNPSTEYSLYVTALNERGSSQPSYSVSATTMSDGGPSAGVDIQKCCARSGVSVTCQRVLCSGDSSLAEPLRIGACLKEAHIAIGCFSGSKNHSVCCKNYGLDDTCTQLCSGRPAPIDFTNLKCLMSMDIMAECFTVGLAEIPGVPQSVKLVDVSTTTAELSWSPPADNPTKVKWYLVQFKEKADNAGNVQVIVSGRLDVQLLKLKPGTLYEVQVQAANSRGSSIPSSRINFSTYVPEISVPGTETPHPTLAPHDYKDCCVKNGISESCQSLCTYERADRITQIACAASISKLLACGADGRDHRSCCMARQIPDKCVQFCNVRYDAPIEVTSEHADCLRDDVIDNVKSCFFEGINRLPGMPRDFHIESATSHTISLSWVEPGRNADIMQEYWFYYGQTDLDIDSMEKKVTTDTRIIVQNLEPSTYYKMFVVAVSQTGGLSQATPTIKQITKPLSSTVDPTLAPVVNGSIYPGELPANSTECCTEQNVSRECMPMCTGASSSADPVTCIADLDKVFMCRADNRDHSECCRRRSVSSDCLDFCRGKPDKSKIGCIQYATEYFSCYVEGIGKLPSPPMKFRVTEVGIDFATFKWDEPVSNGDMVVYDVYYRKADTIPRMVKANVFSPYTIPELIPSTLYEVWVVAVNTHGSSMPSPSFFIHTYASDVPMVSVSQNPGGRVRQGENVTLECIGSGEPMPDVQWTRFDKFLTNESSLLLQNVGKDEAGQYECFVNNSIGNNTGHINLIIEFKPAIHITTPNQYVEADKGIDILLRCDIEGYPTSLRWLRDDAPYLDQATKLRNRDYRIENATIGHTSFFLEIMNVMKWDYGIYMCQANNSYGSSNVSLTLNPPLFDHDNVTEWSIAPAVANVTACCESKGVQAHCMPACSFDIDLDVLTSIPDQVTCINDLTKMIQCAADGRNHTKCCVEKKVDKTCHPACMGQIPPGEGLSMSLCLFSATDIIDCMEEGHDNIPSPPRFVTARLNEENDGSMVIRWGPPSKNPDKVEKYLVSYHPQGGSTIEHEVDGNEFSYEAKLLEHNKLYTVFVLATNHHGSSHSSNQVKIAVNELVPSYPKNLQCALVNATAVKCMWERPRHNYKAITHYSLYYKSSLNQKYKLVNTASSQRQATVGSLMEMELYTFYVAAWSSTVQGSSSFQVTVMTGLTAADMARIQAEHGKRVAIGVGVTIPLLILLGGAAFAFYWFRMRKKGLKFEESVSFDNPGYKKHKNPPSAGQESGLPSSSAVYEDPNHQPNNNIHVNPDEQPIPGDRNAIENPLYNHYTGLDQASMKPAENEYATLEVTQQEDADAQRVHISFNKNTTVT